MNGTIAGQAAPRLAVDDLHVVFTGRDRSVHVLRGVSFEVAPGETLGLVGESGCGKSLTLLAILGLLPPGGRIVHGSIRLDGRELVGRSATELAGLRGREVGLVFQDPMTALNPSMTVGNQVAEPLRIHRLVDPRSDDERRRVLALMGEVGIPEPETRIRAYPHELSGGLQQRIAIAAAVACAPGLLLADEPTTALDVSVQAQVMGQLAAVARDRGCSVVLVTHDLALASGFCDRLAVMYAGQIVEHGPTSEVVRRPRHPYTRGLLDCLPHLGGGRRRLAPIPGEVPTPGRLPGTACAFAPRCPHAHEPCVLGPIPVALTPDGHAARCVLPGEAEAAVGAAGGFS